MPTLGHIPTNTTQDQETEINFLLLKLQWLAGFWRREEGRIVSLEKFELYMCFSLLENSPILDPIKGEIFKFKMTSVTHFHYQLDTCPRLGL